MASTTVNTQIVIQFDDQFTDAAKRANESYIKSLAETQKKAANINQKYDPFYQEYFEGMKEAFDKLDDLEKTAIVIGLSAPFLGLMATTSELIVLIGALGLGVEGFYALWSAGLNLDRWIIEGKPVEEYVEGINEKLNELANSESIGLPPIPPETVQSLESAKTCLEQIQNMQDIFITINLLDNATQEANRIRAEIEAIFSQSITQRVTIMQETVSTMSSSGGLDSIFSDSPMELQTSSTDLTGFGSSVTSSIPGFASGIDRVPRDMLAMIHKDEAVLPKKQAEDFRRGGASGITIQKLDFSFNVPNGLKLDRQEFRNLAFQMRDELKRLDRRIN